MSKCDQRSQFVSVYLFQNGQPCSPERHRVRRDEIDKFFTKTTKSFCYRSKALYTMSGGLVARFTRVDDKMAFVLVPHHEIFIPDNYKEAFSAVVNKKNQCKSPLDRHVSKSAPAIPSSKHQHFVSKDKYPCCDHDSDSEAKAEPCKPILKKQKSSGEIKKQPKKPKKNEKPGVFARCCPCFVKKPKAKPRPTVEAEASCRPVSKSQRNAKMTQTTPEDFKLAIKTLKEAIKEERKRQKLSSSKKSKDSVKSSLEKEALKSCDTYSKPDKKNEEAYVRARDKYQQKRKKMEAKINKALEKEQKRNKKEKL